MANRKPPIDYEKPFGWWGLDRDAPHPVPLSSLIANSTLGPGEAALLSLAVEMRRSVIVAGAESGAGKTTLLTALLAFMDPATRPIYIRGIYERFEYLTDLDPAGRYVLCNEISAHLPTYLWGRGVRSLFDGLGTGFPLATTMHAASGVAVLETLLGYPLEARPDQVANLDLVVLLRRGMVDGREVRRLTSIDRVVIRRGEPDLQPLAIRDPLRSAPQLFSGRMVAALSDWGGITDDEASRLFARQERFLRRAAGDGLDDAARFSRAIEEFRG